MTAAIPNQKALRAVLRIIIDGDDWMSLRQIKEKSDYSSTKAIIDVLYWEQRALIRTKKGKKFIYRAGYQAARLIKKWERQ